MWYNTTNNVIICDKVLSSSLFGAPWNTHTYTETHISHAIGFYSVKFKLAINKCISCQNFFDLCY